MSIYTRQGDGGHTSIIHQHGLSKSDVRIAALAALDELNACLGLVKAAADQDDAKEISEIQTKIIRVSSTLAGHRADILQASDVSRLESRIDAMDALLPKQNGFLIPGETPLSAQIHVARAVCRRAESAYVSTVELYPVGGEGLRFLNRLSDYLYTLARYIDFIYGIRASVLEALSGTPKKLDLTAAKRMLEAIEEKAAEISLCAVAAVVNAQGAVMAVHVMDGAFLVSYDVAVSKAYTAAALRMPTEALATHLQPGGMFCGLESVGKGKITGIGGGLPLTDNGALLGAIGVSGGTAEQDMALARRGAEIFIGS